MSSPRYIRAFSILSEKLMFLIHEMFRNTSESSREVDRSSTQCDQHPGLQLAYIYTHALRRLRVYCICRDGSAPMTPLTIVWIAVFSVQIIAHVCILRWGGESNPTVRTTLKRKRCIARVISWVYVSVGVLGVRIISFDAGVCGVPDPLQAIQVSLKSAWALAPGLTRVSCESLRLRSVTRMRLSLYLCLCPPPLFLSLAFSLSRAHNMIDRVCL